tara:strand:- start:303 stop:782 length:480 start_codon:yes stop_codon:yes gene_type:complete
MHKKFNINKTGNFIQGLRPFSNTIPKNLKQIFKKRGKNFSNLVDNWSKIVGKNISNVSYPVKILSDRNSKKSSLILNVMRGNELEIEYSKSEIMDKVNSFFGYKFLNSLKLTSAQTKKTDKNEFLVRRKKYEKQLDNIENEKLKTQLDELIKAFNEKNY